MTQFPETKESSYKKDLEDSRSAILNVLEDYRLSSEDISHSRSAILNVLEDLGVSKSALEQEKARLVSAIDSVSRAFVLVDTNGKVILHNNRLSGIFGIEHTAWSLEDIEAAFKESLDILASYKKCLIERKILNVKKIPLGSKYLEVYLAPVILEEAKGEVIGVVITIGDITEAEVLERSKEEFFSIASHELRTPLTAIRGNVSLIQQYFSDKLKDPELREMLDDIYKSSIRLIGIVNDFLDMSRLEMGKISFKKEAFDLAELAQAVITEYQTAGAERKLYLKLDRPTGPTSALADPDRTRQVLVNLIANALKFTEKGGVTIKIAAEGKTIKVTITDTGRGMPLASQNLLFRKFQQTESNIYTRDSSQGTGLGLYISHLLVEGMGGKIWLERSEAGQGSTFAFTLPLAKEVAGN